MMNMDHFITRLKANSHQVGQMCPVARVPLKPGDEVVICSDSDVAITLIGWRAIEAHCNEKCPFCGQPVVLRGPPALPVAVPAIIPVRWAALVLLGIGLLLGGLLYVIPVVGQWRSKAEFILAGQMTLVTVVVCLTPTAAHLFTKQHGRVARVIVETLLLVSLFLSFAWWLFGTAILGIGIAYAIVLILLLEIGSHLVERYKVVILRRLSHHAPFRSLRDDAEVINRMFLREQALYISVPLGLIAGTIVGLGRRQTPQTIVVLCLQLVLLLASVVLFSFLLYTFARMSDPLFKTSHKYDLDLACMVSDLRKVYLYDAMHNVILLVAFVAIVVRLWGISIDAKWLIAGLIGLSLVFNQLPYLIGQARLHEKVLERYEGLKRAEIDEKLKKHAPLFPTFDFLAALFITGTGGGTLLSARSVCEECLTVNICA
jgi:hypothetical protein